MPPMTGKFTSLQSFLNGICDAAQYRSLAANIDDGNVNIGARNGRHSLVSIHLRSCWVMSFI